MARKATWLTAPVRRWLERAEHALATKRCGGDQVCPWCRRWMNQFTGTYIRDFAIAELDEITCGNCWGTSVWKWEIGFVFVTAGAPPPGGLRRSDFADGPFIRGMVRQVRATLAGRSIRRAEWSDDIGWILGPPEIGAEPQSKDADAPTSQPDGEGEWPSGQKPTEHNPLTKGADHG